MERRKSVRRQRRTSATNWWRDNRVEKLLECLDERDRMMLILKEVEGFAVEEIAEILDLNANTVKVRLFRARRRIVSEARKRGD